MIQFLLDINQKENRTLPKQEFLNFKEISSKIQFESVLNWLNIPFQKNNGEIKGEGFIISIEKNLFFSPGNLAVKGSVINFVSNAKGIELRDAALILKQEFLSKEKEAKPKRDIPNLTLVWDSYLQERNIKGEIAQEFEMGYVNQRSIVAGRIAFKVYNHDGVPVGYIGYKKDDKNWFFPKGFKRPLYNAHRLTGNKSVIVTVDPFDALRIASLGFERVASLLGNSMTAEQEERLNKFTYVLLFHKQPSNIVNRLCNLSYVRAPVLEKPLMEMSDEEITRLIRPSS